MSLTMRVLVGLAAGFGLGLALAGSSLPATAALLSLLAAVGTLFVNLIRMTAVPLVASLLIASVGSLAASGALGRIGVRAAVLALTLIAVTAAATTMAAAPIFARLRVDAAAAMSLGGSGPSAAPAPAAAPAAMQWLIDLVPQNVFRAAADGAMLPLILFSVLFALALARAAGDRRDAVLRAVQGIADAMQRLVAWILVLAPLGVFALAVPLAARLGLSAAGAVAGYIVVVVALTVVACVVVLYVPAIVFGRLTPRAFIAFCAPAQAVAFASRTSIAALPAMVESAERAGMPPVVSGFIVPLSASIFRLGAAVAMPVGVLFVARLYGVALSPAQLASIVLVVVPTTFTVPGIPFGSIIAMVPVLAAVNLPVEGIGILLAVDTIPDMFRTTANATGTLALAAILRHGAANQQAPSAV